MASSRSMEGDTPSATPSALRATRARLNLSQAECAVALGVALETFRTWDSGRRPSPPAVVRRAEALTVKRPSHQRLPLHILASELNVHVPTLRAAARDGRLTATFNPRPCFGKLTATATREAGARFMAMWYRRTYGRGRRRLVAWFAGRRAAARAASSRNDSILRARFHSSAMASNCSRLAITASARRRACSCRSRSRHSAFQR